MIGVIGGSGVYEIDGVVIKEDKRISTPFGDPSDSYRIGEIAGVEVAFLPGTVLHTILLRIRLTIGRISGVSENSVLKGLSP